MAWRQDHAEPAPAALWDTYSPAVAAEAVAVIAEARDVEASTTSDFLEALPPGTRAQGLEFRMKSPSSLARKLQTKTGAGVIDPNEPQAVRKVSDRLTDVLRYTAVTADHEHLPAAVTATVTRLQRRGYTVVQAETSYVDGNPYKGVHLLVRKGTGRPIEIQLHSELSQRIKDENHVDYEIERDLRRPLPERAAARQRMIERSATIRTPPALQDATRIGGVPLVVKTYPNPYRSTHNEEDGGGTP
ncbi:hypothetical protein ACR8AL_07475 [Clavibacter sepedonicus]|uniref:hypothetical protein n=1 Tax=Clavibacter TaxID=1573 RepID=UPI000302C68C|nr:MULTISPECIES: hypothetical protein [Clavibacter]MBD5382465.1 hypothetical protein [Clavibacter sp.]UUK67217.1 hypothetical protein LRE50_15780 [Clavibacter sepedonicus]